MFLPILLFIVVFGLILYLDTKKPENFPPGPSWLPFLGSTLEVKQVRQNCNYLYKATMLLAQKYNCSKGVLGLRLGKDRIVITCGVNASKEMLLNEDFDGRPKGILYETRTFGKRLGIVLTDGGLWKDQRKFITRHLKEFGFGRRGMNEIVRLEAEHLLKYVMSLCNVNNNDSAVIQMTNLFGIHILNTLWMMIAGIRYNHEDAELKVLQDLLFELFASLDMVGATFSHFPLFRFIAPEASGYSQFVKTHKKIWSFLRNELDKHLKAFNMENQDNDLMDAFIRTMKSSNRGPYYEDSQLMAICMDLFMAGTETTHKSMGFGFLHLLLNPEIQRKAQQEIDTVIGRARLPTIDDRPNLPYNEAIVLESIRHFLGHSYGIPHRSLKNANLCGYTIPKDAMVINNFHTIFMNDEYFEDAKSFNPERFFLDGKLNHPEAFFPFGLGKHRCMGESLAKSNIFMFTVTLLQNFNFELVPGEPAPRTDPIDGATPSVFPFKAHVVLRKK